MDDAAVIRLVNAMRHNTGVLTLVRRGLPIVIADYILRTLVPQVERFDRWIHSLVLWHRLEQRNIANAVWAVVEYLPGAIGKFLR